MFGWREPAKSRVRTPLVIVMPLGLDLDTSIRQRPGPVAGQALVAKPFIEALDDGVVGWFASPREIERDVVLIRPPIKRPRDELGPIVHPDGLGCTADRRKLRDAVTELKGSRKHGAPNSSGPSTL